ncbi:MAG: nuclear transport factor 2 family protein [Parachlamydiaceae bacterium]
MSEKNVTSAVAYYQAMNNKDLSVIEKYLHPKVRFIGPMAEITGKDAKSRPLTNFSQSQRVIVKSRLPSMNNSKDRILRKYDVYSKKKILQFS